MSDNIYDILLERGFIEQITHEDEVKELLSKEKVTFYIGYDPTADSLTVGHFLTVMAMMHMQKAGHRPIVLVGGGTGMVGDPTFKNDMRRIMTVEEIDHNCEQFKGQLSRYIDFSDDKAILVNNAHWLRDIKYVDFLREIGIHFSVNRMLTAEAFKTRMERGLSFLEFNYMLMQSYDFLELHRRYGCKLQLGGNDQWSNIISGVDLIRRVEGESAYGMTFTLLTTSEGIKMGKTEKGALWLDEAKTSPYEFFQYWRNVADADVLKCLSLLTFLPMEEVRALASLKDNKINEAKEVLAYEITKIVHGEEKASDARAAARALFSGAAMEGSIPTTEIASALINDGIDVISILEKAGLIPSRGEGRRLIQQGGLKINGEKVTEFDRIYTTSDLDNGSLMIQKGKKIYHKIESK